MATFVLNGVTFQWQPSPTGAVCRQGPNRRHECIGRADTETAARAVAQSWIDARAVDG